MNDYYHDDKEEEKEKEQNRVIDSNLVCVLEVNCQFFAISKKHSHDEEFLSERE